MRPFSKCLLSAATSGVDVVSAGASRMQTSLLLADQAFDVFFVAFQNQFSYYLCSNKTTKFPSIPALKTGVLFRSLGDHPLPLFTAKDLAFPVTNFEWLHRI